MLKTVILALGATILAAALAVLALAAAGVLDGGSLGRLRASLFGPDRIGIFRSDPVYGWRHRPSSSGRHRYPPNFDVRYHIDRDGHRLTPEAAGGPILLVLGGSFTFGYGVADHQAYPALLQGIFAEVEVFNAGVMAWGTVHAWLKLNEVLESGDEVAAVIYGFIDHHRQRNGLRRSWLDTLRAKNDFRSPWVRVESDRVVWQGLADPDRDGRDQTPALEAAENEMTRCLLEDMARSCLQRSIPFLTVYLPDGSDLGARHPLKPTFDNLAGSGGFVDLRPRVDLVRARFTHDVHLNPEGHRLVAEELAPVVRSLLPLSRPTSGEGPVPAPVPG